MRFSNLIASSRGDSSSTRTCFPAGLGGAFDDVSEEVFDVVDEADEVIGQLVRSEVHARGLRHRAVHVLIFNARGELFLQQRSLLKDNWPGVWDSSSSGHLDRGEDYDSCAVREVNEELGIRLPEIPRRLFKLSASEETGMEFCWVYRAEHEGPFVFQATEVRGGGWFSPASIDEWTSRRPGDFASGFLAIWRRLNGR
jgi:isopentenyl-diphosphate delta-isomerase type 1